MIACRLFLLCLCLAPALADHLRVVVPSFRPEVRFPILVELLDDQGAMKKNAWSEPLLIGVELDPGLMLYGTERLESGISSSGFYYAGDTPLPITVRSRDLETKVVVQPNLLPETIVSGQLTGQTSTWSGVIRLTNDVTVPSGHTLRIEPGTLILLDGVTNGTTAPDLIVHGTVQATGTAAKPILITAGTIHGNWGQIRHDNGSIGTYHYTFIHRGGRAAGEGHTGTGPVLRLSGATIELDHCLVSELTDYTRNSAINVGKAMYARDSEVMIANSVFDEMRMGAEIQGTSLLCTNSYFMEMRGPDDCDGIYLHNSGGKNIQLVDCVFMGGDDDAVDTLSADVVITNCIFRGWLNENEDAKAISVFNGNVQVQRCLIADCFAGISAKAGSGSRSRVQINQSTIITKTNGVAAAWKSNAPGPDIAIHVANSIVRGNPAIRSDFGSTNLTVAYSNLSTDWAGTGVMLQDPLFVNASQYDLRLTPGSPAINAGDPLAPLDANGTRIDLGFHPFVTAPYSAWIRPDGSNITLAFEVPPGRTIITQSSSDFSKWTPVSTNISTDNFVISLPAEATASALFYRFRTE